MDVISATIIGRVFDMEVDVRDSACFEVLHRLNACATKEFACNDRIALVSAYSANSYKRLSRKTVFLEKRNLYVQCIIPLTVYH